MKKDLLVILIEQKTRERSLSIREAAKEIGVSHTTIARIVNGQTTADFDTLVSICKWLGVSPSEVIDGRMEGRRAVASRLAAVIETYPDLERVLSSTLEKIEKGEVPPSVMADLVNYILYRTGGVT